MREHRTCNHSFFSEVTPLSSYIAGFIAADGGLSIQRNTRTVSIAISQKDEGLIEAIRTAVKGNQTISRYSTGNSKIAKITFCSRQMFEDLALLGITPNKTFSLRWPAHLPDEMLRHFLRGYFDGDGCLCRYKRNDNNGFRVTFSLVGNPEFLQEARQFIARKCDISEGDLRQRGDAKWRTLTYGGGQQVIKIAHLMYDGATLCLPRKLSVVRDLLPDTTNVSNLPHCDVHPLASTEGRLISKTEVRSILGLSEWQFHLHVRNGVLKPVNKKLPNQKRVLAHLFRLADVQALTS